MLFSQVALSSVHLFILFYHFSTEKYNEQSQEVGKYGSKDIPTNTDKQGRLLRTLNKINVKGEESFEKLLSYSCYKTLKRHTEERPT